MCKTCSNQVREMDIRDSDLPNLPFKLVKWHCLVSGCNCGPKVKDYGIAPYYYWPVKVRYFKDNKWRGGWLCAHEHWYLCNRHWKMIENRQMEVPKRSPDIFASRFVIPGKACQLNGL